MRILLSNDDGVHALGIKVLYQELSKFADVTVVAPDRNCSGASNSLTLLNPLRADRLDNNFVSVNGTPTDSVHLAISQLMDPLPDLVVAGINNGANLGDDTLIFRHCCCGNRRATYGNACCCCIFSWER